MSEDLRRPYPGLRPFEADDADLFFGREQHVVALLKRLSSSHFVAVVGESGAGKSSLVRAGLLPSLEAGFVVEAGSDWRIAVMRPGGAPLHALADALLAPGLLSPTGGLPNCDFALAELRRGPLGVVQLVRDAHLGSSCNTLIIVDQFEELFRYCREPAQKDEANVFVELLLHASQQRDVPIFVVLTMRSDFVGDCARFRGLPEKLNDNQYLTPRLTREQIATAIREPARVCGGMVEADLIDELCNAVGDDQDQLPLLQHLLMRVWDAASRLERPPRQRDGSQPPWPRVTSELSSGAGGLHLALSNHAQQVYESLPGEQRAITRAMFKCLTDPHSQRRDVRRDAIVSDVAAVADVPAEAVIAVAEEFRADGRHMLMPPTAVPLEAASRLDISHESLLRQWSTLGEWAREEGANAREFVRLREEAERERGEQGQLLSGRALARAQDWLKHARPTPAWAERYAPAGEFAATLAFIDRSEAEARRRKDDEAAAVRREEAARRNKYYLWGAIGAVVLTVAVAGSMYNLAREATRQRDAAEAQGAEAIRQRGIAIENGQRAERFADETADQKKIVEKRNEELGTALEEAHTSQLVSNALLALETEKDPALALLLARQAILEGHTDARTVGALRLAIAAHMPSVVSRFPVATSRVYVPRTSKQAWLDFFLSGSSVSPRGDLAIVPSGNDAVIWSTASGQPVHVLRGHENVVGASAFSPDGALAVTTSADETVRLWNVASGKPVETLKRGTLVNAAVFNKSGTLLVTMGDNNAAEVWTVGKYQEPHCVVKSQGNFIDASFSSDQNLLVTVTHDNGTWHAQVWNVGAEKCPQVDVMFLKEVDGLKWANFSPYGPWLGVVTTTGEATVLGTSDWTSKRMFSPMSEYTDSDDDEDQRTGLPPRIAWSHDGKYFAAAAGDNSVYVSAIEESEPAIELRGHMGRVTSIAFHPDEDILLTTSKDRTARVWRLRKNKSLIEAITLSGHKDTVASGMFAPNGGRVVTAGDDGRARVWTPLFALREAQADGLRAVQYSPDGNQIWMSGLDRARTGRRQIRGVWVSELVAATLTPHKDPIAIPILSAVFYGSSIVNREEESGMLVRDVRNPSSAHVFAGSVGVTRVEGASPDGRFVLASVKGQTMTMVWDSRSPDAKPEALQLPPSAKADDSCEAKGISTDKRVAWYCRNDDVILITRPGGRQPVRIKRTDETNVDSVRFSRSGRRLAVELEDYSVEIFDTETGRSSAPLRGNDAPITGMDFSADEQFLGSTSDDSTARVWDIAAGAQVATVTASEASSLTSLSFSPDGLSLLLVAPDRLFTWRCHSCGEAAALLDEVRRRKVERELTPEEETMYRVKSEELNGERRDGASHSHQPLQARR